MCLLDAIFAHGAKGSEGKLFTKLQTECVELAALDVPVSVKEWEDIIQDTSATTEELCGRCGRSGHRANECSFIAHVSGKALIPAQYLKDRAPRGAQHHTAVAQPPQQPHSAQTGQFFQPQPPSQAPPGRGGHRGGGQSW